jgi:hypothetical protein
LAELLAGHNVPWRQFDVLQIDADNTLAIKRAADPTNEHAAARSAAEQ